MELDIISGCGKTWTINSNNLLMRCSNSVFSALIPSSSHRVHLGIHYISRKTCPNVEECGPEKGRWVEVRGDEMALKRADWLRSLVIQNKFSELTRLRPFMNSNRNNFSRY